MTDADLRQHPAYTLAIADAAALVDRHMHSLIPDAAPRFAAGHTVACFRILRELRSFTGPPKPSPAVKERRYVGTLITRLDLPGHTSR